MPVFGPAELKALAEREMQKEKIPFYAPAPERVSSAPKISTLSPLQAALLGGAMDGVSTTMFLKQGHSKEDNALAQGMSPVVTGALGAVIGPAAHMLLKKVSPKFANLVGAEAGAKQLSLGASNFAAMGKRDHMSSEQDVRQKLDELARKGGR